MVTAEGGVRGDPQCVIYAALHKISWRTTGTLVFMRLQCEEWGYAKRGYSDFLNLKTITVKHSNSTIRRQIHFFCVVVITFLQIQTNLWWSFTQALKKELGFLHVFSSHTLGTAGISDQGNEDDAFPLAARGSDQGQNFSKCDLAGFPAVIWKVPTAFSFHWKGRGLHPQIADQTALFLRAASSAQFATFCPRPQISWRFRNNIVVWYWELAGILLMMQLKCRISLCSVLVCSLRCSVQSPFWIAARLAMWQC